MESSNDITPLMGHTSLNPEGTSTIVLIHGAFVDGDDWNLVVPHLSDYHLLLPDLPGHGQSRHLTPFSLEYLALLLHHLISTKAIGGKAHIVGHSLGARVAIHLAASYPSVVNSIVVSGYPSPSNNNKQKSWLTPYIPRGLWLEQRLENAIPRSILRYLMDGIDIRPTDPTIVTMPLCTQLIETLTSSKWPSPWPAPTLIIAATKSGVIPSMDSPKDARRMAEIGREMNAKTRAVEHGGMRHPWNRQAPILFAETVRGWVERGEVLVGEFEEL